MEAQRIPLPSCRNGRVLHIAGASGLALLLSGFLASADDLSSAQSANGSFLSNWFARSDASKEEQPHWITPVVTVTPRLEQEYRYDQTWQSRPKNVDLDNYGGGKGLELIPTENTEIILGVPGYQTRTSPKGREEGWTDETFLLKYRAASANEEHGNYIVTGFLGVSVPTGDNVFTNHQTIITPTLAAGKGWGSRSSGFDIQSTIGIAIPTGDRRTLGMPIAWNTAFQGHVLEKFWPEIEVNYTYYKDGPNDGKTQVAVTTGLVLGRFEITPRVKFIIGGGYQKPVSSFYTYNHTWLLTARAAF
jgi:hypothetical protein